MSKYADVLKQCACHKVRVAARTVTRAYDDALRSTGLRATQLAVLIAIGCEEASSIQALALVMGMDRSTLTRNLRPLESAGLIVIGQEGQYRSRTLHLTDEGKHRISEALPLWRKAQRTLATKLGAEQWSELQANLDHLGSST